MAPSSNKALRILEESIQRNERIVIDGDNKHDVEVTTWSGNGDNDDQSSGMDSGNTQSTTVLSSIGKRNAEEDQATFCGKCPVPLLVILSCTGIAILIMCLFVFDVIDNSDFEGVPVLGDIDFGGFFDTDPFGGQVTPFTPPEEAFKWDDGGTPGLELTLLNSLDDSWQQYYTKAVFQWENGVPDTLTLTSRRVDYDPECNQENYVMKVCNADYGETDWRGLNIVLFDKLTKLIYSSAAKMNDFYLKEASNEQRQYTMCHELGHGFGLPHWDEDFNNRNIGNCMDYTSEPASNAQPDKSNFDFLETLYGAPNRTDEAGGGSGRPDDGDDDPRPPSTIGWGGRRNMRTLLRGSSDRITHDIVQVPHARRVEAVPRKLMDRLNEASRALESIPGDGQSSDAWTRVNPDEDADGKILELDLGDGLIARAFVLGLK